MSVKGSYRRSNSPHKFKKKDEEQILHFQRRFKQRTGTCCNVKELKNKIVNKELVLIGRQSKRVYMFEFFVENEKYILIYDSCRRNFVTILYFDKILLAENGIIFNEGEYLSINYKKHSVKKRIFIEKELNKILNVNEVM